MATINEYNVKFTCFKPPRSIFFIQSCDSSSIPSSGHSLMSAAINSQAVITKHGHPMPPLPQQFTPTQTFVPPLPPPFNIPPKLHAVEEVMKDHQGTDVNSLRQLATDIAREAIFGKSYKILA